MIETVEKRFVPVYFVQEKIEKCLRLHKFSSDAKLTIKASACLSNILLSFIIDVSKVL